MLVHPVGAPSVNFKSDSNQFKFGTFVPPAQPEPKRKTWLKWALGAVGVIAVCATISRTGDKFTQTFAALFRGAQKDSNPEVLQKFAAPLDYSKMPEIATIESMAGMKDVKAQLMPVIEKIKNGNRSADLYKDGKGSGKIFSVVLEGPSGTGKTFSARAFAKSIDAEVFQVNSSDIVTKWLGESESNFSAVCDEIIKRASANPKKQIVLEFDELEGLFRDRSKDGASEHNSKMITTILQQLDRLIAQNDLTNNITVVGTTNLYNNLDKAVQTRFNKCITVGLPDKENLAAVIKSKFNVFKDEKLKEASLNYDDLAQIMSNKNKQANMRDVNYIFEEMGNRLSAEEHKSLDSGFVKDIFTKYMDQKRITPLTAETLS